MTDREPDRSRPNRFGRRSRPDVGEALLAAAGIEFAAKGFEGASTVAIAEAANAHQPQINYYFGSKLGLWKAVVDHLYDELSQELRGIDFETDAGDGFAEFLRRFVNFSAGRTELFQLIMHEGTLPGERLNWLYEHYQRTRQEWMSTLWKQLRDEGIAAPVDERLIFHYLTGAVSLLLVVKAEAEMVLGPEAASDEIRDAHIAGLISTMLPGL